LGGATAAWPLAARAQQNEPMRRIGALTGIGDDESAQARFAVFVQALAQLGWIDGRNVRIDYRWGGGDIEKLGNTRWNWPPTRRTPFSPLALQPWSSCSKQRVRCRSCSRSPPIR